MTTTVKKWGNSAAVRIPAAVMRSVSLALDDDVDVRGEDGRIVIELAPKKTYDLTELLGGITAKNRHDPADFGAPEGNEAW